MYSRSLKILFCRYAAKHPQRIKTIDSTRGVEEIFNDVMVLLDKL